MFYPHTDGHSSVLAAHGRESKSRPIDRKSDALHHQATNPRLSRLLFVLRVIQVNTLWRCCIMTDPSPAVHSVVRYTTPAKCKSEIFQRSLLSAVLSNLTVGIIQLLFRQFQTVLFGLLILFSIACADLLLFFVFFR